MTTKYERDAEDFLNLAEATMWNVYSDAFSEDHAELKASAQVLALLSIADSLVTLTKHLTEKEEGAR
jgi:hypothetical protein